MKMTISLFPYYLFYLLFIHYLLSIYFIYFLRHKKSFNEDDDEFNHVQDMFILIKILNTIQYFFLS